MPQETVSGSGNQVGGLVGVNSSGTVTNSYATGAVSGSGVNVGGLVGNNNSGGTVTNCYAIGGGELVGLNAGTTTNSFKKTTMQMQALTGADTPDGVTPDATTIQSGWGELSWDFGTDSQYPAVRNSSGFLLCGQPAPRSSLTCPLAPNATWLHWK